MTSPCPADVAPSLAPARRRRLVAALWACAAVLAVFQSLDPGHVTDPDGISYLDIGDALMRGDWSLAVNGLWSPLYAWVLGVVLWLVRPSAYHELAVVQAVNLALYGVALLGFHFFLREVLCFQRTRADSRAPGLPESVWLVLGYALFIWSTLALIRVDQESPDMLVTGLIYVAAGSVLRLAGGDTRARTFALLGAVLGVGFYAKASIVILGSLFVGVTTIALARRHRWGTAVRGGALAAAVFATIAAPLVVAVSLKYGRPMLSDQGRVNYLVHVNQVPYVHFTGEATGPRSPVGVPSHPSRKIFDKPAIYEFATPIAGTYPPWFDPSYWFAGLQPRLDPVAHLHVLETAAGIYFSILIVLTGSLLIVWAAVAALPGRQSGRCWIGPGGWWLAIPGAATMGVMALVHAEPRYVAAPVTLVWTGLLLDVRLPESREARRLALNALLGVAALLLTMTAVSPLVTRMASSPLQSAVSVMRSLARGRDPWPREAWRIAAGLSRLGVAPGDGVAVVGSGFHASVWARLLRARIVAELPRGEVDAFWALDPARRAEAVHALAGAGAKAIVARCIANRDAAADWRLLDGTDYCAHLPRPFK